MLFVIGVENILETTHVVVIIKIGLFFIVWFGNMKSIALYNLKLPKDVIDIICRFNFYTLSECIEITKYKRRNVFNELKYIERFQYYGYQPYHTGIYYHIQINMITINDEIDIYKEMNLCICTNCYEFIKNMPKTNCLCKC